MEIFTRKTKYGDKVKCQYFNGKRYTRYKNNKMYNYGRRRLHRDVWEYYKGEIPEGYVIYHKDHDLDNNEINNLAMVRKELQSKLTGYRKFKESPGYFIRLVRKSVKSSKNRIRDSKKDKKITTFARNCKRNKSYNKICKFSKKEFTTNVRNKKYCSDSCRLKYRWYSGVDDVKRVCIGCGRTFITNKYSKTRYCSISCGIKHCKS